MHKSSKCADCGREVKLIGQGLCCACYHKKRRKELKAAGRAQGEDFTVPVDFSPMAFLLEELQKRAGSELRDVGRQILWELNKSLGAGVC